MKPRVLFVARTRYALPLSETLQRRFDALSEVLDWRQFGTSASGRELVNDRFTLVAKFPVARLEGAAFYGALPYRLAREIRSFRPEVLIVQGAEDSTLALAARRLARSHAPLVFDVHGDWRNNTRVYGSTGRRLLSPLADGLARFAVKHADGVRTVSDFTSGLVREQGVEPVATFPAYMDLAPFLDPPKAPLPAAPSALFVGVLERYKAVDILAEAWPRVVAAHPGVGLHVVGAGRLEGIVRSLAEDESLGVRWTERLDTPGVAAALDASTALVLPSRREGMGRVIVEAFCRGRAVVGTRSGGIPDLVQDGSNGLLVPPEDPAALAAALGLVLGDRALAERLGDGARVSSAAWAATPEEFARRMRELVDAVLARSRS